MFRYAEVLVDVANRRLDQSYHYSIPEHLCIKSGMRVLIPLQNRKVQGLVVNLLNDLPEGLDSINLKPVLEIAERDSLVPEDLIELSQWLAQTTVCSVAQSLHTVWPLLKGKVEEWIVPLATMEDTDIQALQWLDSEAFRALIVLNRARKKAIPLKTFLKRADVTQGMLEKLLKQGWVKKRFAFLRREKILLLSSQLLQGKKTRQKIWKLRGIEPTS